MTSFGYTVASWILAGLLASFCGVFLFLGRSIHRTLALVQVPLSLHLWLAPLAPAMATWSLHASSGGRTFPMVSGVEPGTVVLLLTAIIVYLLSPVASGKCYPLSGGAGVIVNLAALVASMIAMQRLVFKDPAVLRRLLYAGLSEIPTQDTFTVILTATTVFLLLTKLFPDHFLGTLMCPTCTCSAPSGEDRWKALLMLLSGLAIASVLPVTGALFTLALVVAPPFVAARQYSSVSALLLVSSLIGMTLSLFSILGERYIGLPSGLLGTFLTGLLLFIVPERSAHGRQ